MSAQRSKLSYIFIITEFTQQLGEISKYIVHCQNSRTVTIMSSGINHDYGFLTFTLTYKLQ